jgi:hypothetical protein
MAVMASVTAPAVIIATMVLGFCTSARAQVIAQLPYPHAATCSDFHHHRKAGTWTPKVGIQITSASGTTSLGPGDSFAGGKVIGGYDLGKWLDDNCHKSKVW